MSVSRSVLKEIAVEALRKYWEISGLERLGNAPERFLQSFMALEIQRMKISDYVILEPGEREIGEYAGKENVDFRMLKNVRHGYTDIVLFKGDKPYSAIEIKRAWNEKDCNEDVKRLRKFVNSGMIDNAFIVVYTSTRTKKEVANPDTVIDRFRNIKDQILADGNIVRYIESKTVGDQDTQEDYSWGVAVFEIR